MPRGEENCGKTGANDKYGVTGALRENFFTFFCICTLFFCGVVFLFVNRFVGLWVAFFSFFVFVWVGGVVVSFQVRRGWFPFPRSRGSHGNS